MFYRLSEFNGFVFHFEYYFNFIVNNGVEKNIMVSSRINSECCTISSMCVFAEVNIDTVYKFNAFMFSAEHCISDF